LAFLTIDRLIRHVMQPSHSTQDAQVAAVLEAPPETAPAPRPRRARRLSILFIGLLAVGAVFTGACPDHLLAAGEATAPRAAAAQTTAPISFSMSDIAWEVLFHCGIPFAATVPSQAAASPG
jgi:hypothetical protein